MACKDVWGQMDRGETGNLADVILAVCHDVQGELPQKGSKLLQEKLAKKKIGEIELQPKINDNNKISTPYRGVWSWRLSFFMIFSLIILAAKS